MIVDNVSGRKVSVRYRDADNVRVTDTIEHIYPYLFLQKHDAELITYEAAFKEEGYEGLYGEELVKVSFHRQSDMYEIRKRFTSSWEGNIPITNRALIDSKRNYDMYNHRIWYLDCEWDKKERLTVITVYDSYTERMMTWFVHPDKKLRPRGDIWVKTPEGYRSCQSEKSMLQNFAQTMQKQDPDVIAGWWLMGADMKVLFTRFRANGLDPGLMSPYGRVRNEFDDYSQCLFGRITIDLMVTVVRLYQVKNGQLPGRKLDDVAEYVLGEKKVELEDGHDTYYSDIKKYLEYSVQDVALLPKLDEAVNAIQHYLSIQHIVQCDFLTTPWVTRITTVLLLRDDKFNVRIPTTAQFDKVPYSGADIQEPEPGVYENVAILDVKAMYHSNVLKENISWDTLIDAQKGLFDKDAPVGALGRAMNLLTELRNKYKNNMRLATTEQEKRRWDSAQFATKSLVASLYGVCGDSRYGMYHPAVAAAITRESRKTLFHLRDLAEEYGMPSIYGHTDSIFVQVETPELCMEKMKTINELMSPIETEFEKWTERMLIKAKNRYAGKVTWTDGEHHEPQYYVKGIESKQGRMPEAMKEAMGMTINSILDGASEATVTGNVCDYIHRLVEKEIPIDDLKMKGKLRRDLHKYRSISGSAAAAMWANKNLGKEYRGGDYFWCLLDDSGQYIGFDKVEELPKSVRIGYKVFVERFVIKKLQPYYEITGWDLGPLQLAMNGRKQAEWL
jgi:DNA polymerase elongation subunit (family B)